MKSKKILSALLCIAMLLTLAPALTASASAAWDGTVDTSWLSAEPFFIDTEAQLAGLAALVNGGRDFEGKTVALGADLDLERKSWTPIGADSDTPFKGVFDGEGYSITGLYAENY